MSQIARKAPRFGRALTIDNTFVIFPGAFLTALGEGMLNLGLVFFLRERYGASPSLIGWFVGFSVLVYILGCLGLRPFLDRLRPQLLLPAAVAGIVLSLLLLYLLPSLPLSFLFSALYRLALAFFWPPVMGWLSQGVEGQQLGRRQSRFNLSWSLGLVASYALAGAASERAVALPILLTAGTFGVYLAFLLACLAAVPALRRSGTDGAVAAPGAAAAAPASVPNPAAAEPAAAALPPARVLGEGTPLRYPAWAGMFAAYVVSGMIAAVFPLFAADVLRVSKSTVGALISARTLTQSVGFLLLGFAGFWQFRRRYILLGQLYLAVLLALMSQARSLGFFAVLLPLIGLAMAFSYSSGLFYGIAGSRHRAGRMAIHESLLNGGYITGATAGG
ncbi:MAG: MFS transporter, partial [Spirochaetales bacterium]|nr:MFS transporter [Spirochaetales bacterium]